MARLPREIASKLPKYPEVPAILLGRLALSEGFRGQKLVEFLLLDAESKQVASPAVIVDAKDESARHFYEHFDFLALPSTPNRCAPDTFPNGHPRATETTAVRAAKYQPLLDEHCRRQRQ
jgi:hypothetical protein